MADETPLKLAAEKSSAWRTAGDLLVVWALVGVVVCIGAAAPGNTYAYGQLRQVGSAVAAVQAVENPQDSDTYGTWLLPRDQFGGLACRPPLQTWAQGLVLRATGVYDDFTFRLPTILAALVTASLVYVLGRRWFSRWAGLLAACLWVSIHHMSKLMYVASADMMLTMWITLSIVCADRLLFHRVGRRKRWKWVAGLWASMILGAMTRGWGVLNLALVGVFLAAGTAMLPGFAVLRLVRGFWGKLVLLGRLIRRRWRRAVRATRFWWGILAMVLVLAPFWIAMFYQGGRTFRDFAYCEFILRLTGGAGGGGASLPAAVALLYYTLPVPFFAAGALLLNRPRRWFAYDSPMTLPLCWLAAVVVPFSLVRGFRPEYLLPCYAAGAIMGGWAVDELLRRGASHRTWAAAVRHLLAAGPIVICVMLIVAAAGYLLHSRLPMFVQSLLPMPAEVSPAGWIILPVLICEGVLGLAIAIRASLRWRLGAMTAIAVIGMLGLMHLDRSFIARPARTGDGRRLVQFARDVRGVIGGDKLAVYRAEQLGAELYIGRWGTRVGEPEDVSAKPGTQQADLLAADNARQAIHWMGEAGMQWLITCDRGLVELGAAVETPDGRVRLPIGRGERRFRTLPESLGTVAFETERIVSSRWGKVYLIRLDWRKLGACEAQESWKQAVWTGHLAGKQEVGN